jgi:uncharacterized protein (DUF1800 family)
MSQIAQPQGLGTNVFTTAADDYPALSNRMPKFFGDNRAARRAVDRLTFGFTRYEIDLLRYQGIEGYIRYHMHPAAIDDSALDAFLAANYPTLVMTPQQLSVTQFGDTTNQLIRARIMRAVFSRRQLLERIVECWTDHFNIWIRDDPGSFLKTVDDRDVIRANALGTFPNLLRASAHSPAMLTFLNNDTNTASAPNENYGRELMELHSLSVNGGYSQSDVQQVAKCFTGWTYNSTAGATQWQFQFVSSRHATGNKTVLGQIIPYQSGASGQQEGETVLNILADHPSTRTFIAYKLLRHFYSHTPSQSDIASVAQIYASTGGDIPSMLDYVLHKSVTLAAPAKFKRPMHLLASTLRALSARVVSPNNLQTPLSAAGHTPFDWQAPDGYPDTLEAWSSLLLARWNFGASLANDSYGNATTPTGIFLTPADTIGTVTTGALVADAINAAAFNLTMPKPERDAILAYLGATPTTAKIKEAMGMAVAMPNFQWY